MCLVNIKDVRIMLRLKLVERKSINLCFGLSWIFMGIFGIYLIIL